MTPPLVTASTQTEEQGALRAGGGGGLTAEGSLLCAAALLQVVLEKSLPHLFPDGFQPRWEAAGELRLPQHPWGPAGPPGPPVHPGPPQLGCSHSAEWCHLGSPLDLVGTFHPLGGHQGGSPTRFCGLPPSPSSAAHWGEEGSQVKGEGATPCLVAPPQLVGLLPLLAAPPVLQAGGLQLLRPAGPVCGTAPAPSHPLSFPRAAGSGSCEGQGMEAASGAISCLCACRCRRLPGRPWVREPPSAGGAARQPRCSLWVWGEPVPGTRLLLELSVTRVSLSRALREMLPSTGSCPPRWQ